MIYYVATERFSSTVQHFLRRHSREARGILGSLTWEELFFERGGPVGHYIFTDFDRLSRYELECAAAFAMALQKAAPEARILNHPLRVLERYPLLVALHKAGINDFTATRLEAGERPTRYPVFIRAEDGYGGPETDVIADAAAFDGALADLSRRGLPLRGRVAIGYAAERGLNGYFQKYAAFNVGGEIIPSRIMNGHTWVVKTNVSEMTWAEPRDRDLGHEARAVDTEMAYVCDNPHQSLLAQAFALAGIEFGRADYGIVSGRVQIYEINTNPKFPSSGRQSKGANRGERAGPKSVVANRFLAALRRINVPLESGRIGFRETRPRAHNVHLPRWRFINSLMRRALDELRARDRGSGQPQ